jgi:hypothetical protein
MARKPDAPAGNCKLCLRQAPLAKSHVIPEFIFSGMYDQKHRFLEVADVNAGKIALGQKGFRERLLCVECEQRLNRHERHARRLFKDDLPLPVTPEFRRVRITNVNPQTLRLFLLSVLWRAGVSSLPVFKHIDLGPHQEKLRTILLSEDALPTGGYPCVVMPLFFEGKHFKDFIVEPTPVRLAGHKCFRFVFGGFVSIFFVSSHMLPPAYLKTALPQSGPFDLYGKELRDVAFLRDVWNRAGETTRDVVTSFGTE